MKNTLILAAVMWSACSLAGGAWGQNLLDQQLGNKPAKADAPAAEKETKPDAPSQADVPTRPPEVRVGGPDIVDPNAVRKVDDADLINKLTKPDDKPQVSGNQVADHLKDMLDRMGQSEERLTSKDTGGVTQETQRRIMTDLDVLIEFARQQNQQGPTKSDPQNQQSQQRSYSQGNQQNQGGTTAANSSFIPRGSSETPRLNEDIHSHGPNEWGRLPGRDRDLVSHGANEEYLSSYRDLIDRYYQALAELGKSKNH